VDGVGALRTKRTRITIALAGSIAVAVLWLIFVDMPAGVRVAILPALIYPMWIPVFAREQAASPGVRRWLFVAVGGLLLLVLASILVWLLATR